jgi:hypothetical protein
MLLMPRDVHTTPHVPIAVSNKANPVSAKGLSVAFEVIRLLGRVLERYRAGEPRRTHFGRVIVSRVG